MENKYNLPTYEQCVEIASHSNNAVFYENKSTVNGYDISLFNYHICYKGLFDMPIPGSDLKGHELRGLLFIFDKGELYSRNLLLRKFFNINQEEETNIDIIRKNGITDIYEKSDGSVITFNKFPDGKILARTKMSFITTQAESSQKIYESNYDIQNLVNYCLDNDIVPIFEYVGPDNRVVLEYNKSDLILLRLRCNKTGIYLNLDDYKELIGNVITAKRVEYHNIDDLIKISKEATEMEGWVFTSNNQLVKLKTEWYFSYHGLYTETINRLNLLIQSILDNTIDDVLSRLDAEKQKEIDEVIHVINSYIEDVHKVVHESIKLDFDGDVPKFVKKYKKHEYFAFMMSHINRDQLTESIEEFIRRNTYFLERARKWYGDISKRFL